MIGRAFATILLGSVALSLSPALATTTSSAMIESGEVLTRAQVPSSRLPATVLHAVTAFDAQCRAAGGKPGKSPYLLIMADITHDGFWDYIVDANDYDCQGAVNALRGKEGAALTVYAGGADNSAIQIHSATVFASRIIPANGGPTLSFTDVAECGHADAVNPLNEKWEMCRRLAYWGKTKQKFDLTPRPSPSGAAAGPLGAALAATRPKIAGAPPPPAPPPSMAALYAKPAAENFVEAVRLLTAAVGMGDTQAMWTLGTVYAVFANGEGVQKDYPKAIALYRQGAEAGNAQCMLALAGAYEIGNFGLPRDKVQSDEWYRRWAKTNPPYAASTLARRNIQP